MRKPPAAKHPTQCTCGAPLPVHLAVLGLTEHVCGCEKLFTVVDGQFVDTGRSEANPFAPRVRP
jgi:hypothetical protein